MIVLSLSIEIMMQGTKVIKALLLLVLVLVFHSSYSLISQIQSECELEALNIGSRLADSYTSYDEATEWDVRIHHDYLVEHLGKMRTFSCLF